MNILGLSVNSSQTAAALLNNGNIVAAVAEERLDRIKLSRAFPKRAIRYCLKAAGLERVDQFNGIAISWNPCVNMRQINMSGFTEWRRYDPEWLYIVPNQIMSMAGSQAFQGNVLSMHVEGGSNCNFYFVDHHASHLAHAIGQSPFEKGLAVVADEYGEFDSVTIATFSGNSYQILKRIPYPNSLGVFFAAITEYLGFQPNSDEWKVMGAAAYGDPARFARKMEQLLMWDEELGEWILDTRFIEHSNMKRAGYLNERLIEFIGMPVRYDDSDLTQVHYDFASSAQAVFEKRIFQILNFYARKTGERNLCASGGCFMNSLANGKIIQNTPIENIFIPYAAADNGGAMGAALHVWHYVLNKPRLPHQYPPTPFLGPEYSDEHIEAVLRRFNLPVRKLSNPPKHAALAIAEGRLVGWFQGRMEFGERALGNRSILADPRVPEMKDKINAAVKYREAFRPFAPSVLSERVSDFFQIPSNVIVPYMEQVYPIRVQKRGLIPAVVHADGTGRLQTVDRQINPKYYELIRQFDIITGVPLVLNTSFNVKGEPIVCSPEDAVRTFFSCGLDILLIGSFLISKKTINHGIEDATT